MQRNRSRNCARSIRGWWCCAGTAYKAKKPVVTELTERIAHGRIVDGHGDLLAEDIFVLPDGFRILDCLDFDDELRYVDGLDDAAFLAMDLEFLGHPQQSDAFSNYYLHAAGDSSPPSLRHHYIAYRAMVRAKTDHIRADQGDVEATRRAERHLDLAVEHLEQGAVRLALVGGLPGTRKSTMAACLSAATGAVVISSDSVRAGLRATGSIAGTAGVFGAGAYRSAAKALVYAQMFSHARQRLEHGLSVILDASWTDSDQRARAAAALADETRNESHHPMAVRNLHRAPGSPRFRGRSSRGERAGRLSRNR